ncbi:MAG: HisA/HisF-related TIM barrel protein [Chloroflexota bacterium]
MDVIPSIDLENGRSRIVYWPGAASGVGAPTDRPDRIAIEFVKLGARLLHLVDFDGARAGKPVNLEAVGSIAGHVAVPLQIAGGVETADAIRLAFGAGATRVVLPLGVADEPDTLRECVAVAGEWLAVGLDPRPDRLAAFPWRRPAPPTIDGLAQELIAAGVSRLVLSHGGSGPDLDLIGRLSASAPIDILVAGGVRELDALRALRDAGVSGVILGEALLSGAIAYDDALQAAA